MPNVIRHSTAGPDNTPQNSAKPDAAETMDLAVGSVSDTETTHAHHNASYATLNNNKAQDITPKPRTQNKPIPNFSAQQRARFWSLVDRRGPDECWPWMGAQNYANPARTIFYGIFCGYKAHRVAYTLGVGKIPKGKTIDHVRANGCTSTLCCNYERHLEPVSMSEQVIRRDSSRVVAPGFSKCKWGHVRPIGRTAHCLGCTTLNVALNILRHPEKHASARILWAQGEIEKNPAFAEAKGFAAVAP